MPQTIDIPDVGAIDFPDEMSPEEVAATAGRLFSEAKSNAVRLQRPHPYTSTTVGGPRTSLVPASVALGSLLQEQQMAVRPGDEPLPLPEPSQAFIDRNPVLGSFLQRSSQIAGGLGSRNSLLSLPLFAVPYVGPGLALGLGAKGLGAGLGEVFSGPSLSQPLGTGESVGGGSAETFANALMLAVGGHQARRPIAEATPQGQARYALMDELVKEPTFARTADPPPQRQLGMSLANILQDPDIRGLVERVLQETTPAGRIVKPGQPRALGELQELAYPEEHVAPSEVGLVAGGPATARIERPGGGAALSGKISFAAEAPTMTSVVPQPERTLSEQERLMQQSFVPAKGTAALAEQKGGPIGKTAKPTIQPGGAQGVGKPSGLGVKAAQERAASERGQTGAIRPEGSERRQAELWNNLLEKVKGLKGMTGLPDVVLPLDPERMTDRPEGLEGVRRWPVGVEGVESLPGWPIVVRHLNDEQLADIAGNVEVALIDAERSGSPDAVDYQHIFGRVTNELNRRGLPNPSRPGGFGPSEAEEPKQPGITIPQPEEGWVSAFDRRKKSQEGSFVLPGPELMRTASGFKKTATIAGQQLLNRVRNLLHPDEFKAYENSGLRTFLARPRSPDEVAKWMEANGPKVDVHAYGMEGVVSEAKREYDKMSHEWLDTLDGGSRDTVKRAEGLFARNEDAKAYAELANIGTQNYTKAHRFLEIGRQIKNEPRDTSPRATSAYEHVSAFDTHQPMPEWTKSKSRRNVQRVDVVIPRTTEKLGVDKDASSQMWTDEERKLANDLWTPDKVHENLPNTLGWAMIQYKTGPKGEKMAVMGEVQSRWGQERREAVKSIENKEGDNRGTRAYRINEAAKIPDHPLLRDYNRLILKAAIDQATKEGATHIVLPDEKTAMMNEGHDLDPPSFVKPSAANVRLAKQLLEGNDLHGLYKTDLEKLAEGEEIEAAFPGKWQGPGFELDRKVSEEAGMRLNYGITLPKIAEELTGSKGEEVDLGQHKNAFDYEDVGTGRRRLYPTEEEGRWVSKIRKDLIFKNPDESFKTSVTGRSYDLAKVKQRTEPFKLFGSDKMEKQTPAGLRIKEAQERGARQRGETGAIFPEGSERRFRNLYEGKVWFNNLPEVLRRSVRRFLNESYSSPDEAMTTIWRTQFINDLPKGANVEEWTSKLDEYVNLALGERQETMPKRKLVEESVLPAIKTRRTVPGTVSLSWPGNIWVSPEGKLLDAEPSHYESGAKALGLPEASYRSHASVDIKVESMGKVENAMTSAGYLVVRGHSQGLDILRGNLTLPQKVALEEYAKENRKVLLDLRNEREVTLYKPPSGLNIQLGGRGEVGAITIQPLEDAWKKMSAMAKSVPVKERAAQLLDAAENAARIFGRQHGNELRVMLPKPIQQDALTFVLGTKDNRGKLADFLTVIGNKSPKATRAIRYAQAHWDELQLAAARAIQMVAVQRFREQNSGVQTINHYELMYDPRGTGVSSPDFKTTKYYPNMADVIANEKVPPNFNAADLIERRIAIGTKRMNRIKWVESFGAMKDPATGDPLVKPMINDPLNNKVAPAGYEAREVYGGIRIAVKKGYTDILDTLIRPSAIRSSAPGRLALNSEATIKHGMLLFDSFHLSRVLQKQAFLTGFKKMGDPLSLLEYNRKTVEMLVANGDMPASALTSYDSLRPRMQLLVRNGLNVGRIAESLYADIIRRPWDVKGVDVNIPGHFNKYVFEKVSRSAMLNSAMIEFDRTKANNPSWSDEQVASHVAKQINVYYGNLMRQGLLKSATLRDIGQLTLLAPQWFESMAQVELRAYYQTAKVPYDAAFERALKVGTMAKGVGRGLFAYLIGTQLINFFTRGHPTTENPEPEHKLDAWIPDPTGKTGGFWLNPFSVPAEITHDWMRYSHVKQNQMQVAAQILKNKSSPLERSIQTLLSQRDFTGAKILETKDVLKESARAILPTPLPLSGVTSEVPGQGIRQLFSTAGFKVEPSSRQVFLLDKKSQELYKANFSQLPISERLDVAQQVEKEPLPLQQRYSIAQRATDKEFRRQAEIRHALPKDIQAFVGKHSLTVPAPEPNFIRGGIAIPFNEAEQEMLRERAVHWYTEAFHNLMRDKEFETLPQVRKQKIVDRYLVGAKERARREVLSGARR